MFSFYIIVTPCDSEQNFPIIYIFQSSNFQRPSSLFCHVMFFFVLLLAACQCCNGSSSLCFVLLRFLVIRIVVCMDTKATP